MKKFLGIGLLLLASTAYAQQAQETVEQQLARCHGESSALAQALSAVVANSGIQMKQQQDAMRQMMQQVKEEAAKPKIEEKK